MDDRDCIQLALLRLPRPEPGNSYPILVSPSYVKGERAPIAEELKKMAKGMPGRSPKGEIEWVTKAAASLPHEGKYKAPELQLLEDYQWNPKIVVQEYEVDFRKFRNKEIAWIYPPSYSADGRWCVAHRGFPWSMHHGERWTLMERTPKGWTYRAQLELIYL